MRRQFLAVATYFVIALVLFFTGIPVYLMLKISFADPATFMNTGEFSFTLDNLKRAIFSGNLWPPLRKSLTVALGTAFLSVAMAAPGSYVLAKLPRRTGYALVILIFFTRMFPEVSIALPVSLNFIRLGLFDTDLGLMMAHLIRVLPLVAWILVGTFESIPKELEEAARIDGCSQFKAFYKIALPVAKPGIIVGLIFGFLNSWDEFIYATYLCLLNKTLPLTVYYYVKRGGWFLSSTYAWIVTFPVALFTYYFQKYLQSGYLAGAVKE
jgi:trehalose transport system permease protein